MWGKNRQVFTGVLVGTAVALAGCTRLPDLPDTRSADLQNRSYPDFIPLDNLPDANPSRAAEVTADINSRLARINRSLRRLSGPVLTSAERRKLLSRRTIVRGQVLSPADRARLGTKIR